jgi:multidrug efflux pump subunit AcrA (membrane-fusion protein)
MTRPTRRAAVGSAVEAAGGGGQLSGRVEADSDKSTFDRLKAASATPGVVAGNDVAIADKAADASANTVTAAQQSVEAARQALNAVRDMEGYLRVTAPFAGVVTERTYIRARSSDPRTAPTRRHCCGSWTPPASVSSCPCRRRTPPR